MAWYRWAFESVGGFDPEYHKAGDDVDFCWRVQQAGHDIAFSPTAIVWHYRRFTLSAFRKQQEGYGEAESMLRFKHLIFFGPTGTAKWRGQIYGTPRFSWFINRPIIYHGIFGEGFFQSIYPTPQSEIAAYLSSIEWFALTIFLFGLGILLAGAAHRALPHVWRHALRRAFLHAARADRTEVRHHPGASARHVPRLRAAARPRMVALFHLAAFQTHAARRHPRRTKNLPAGTELRGKSARRQFTGAKRRRTGINLLTSIFQLLEEEGWRYSTDTGWNEWDIQIYGNFWWSITLQTVTEYHGGMKALTRARFVIGSSPQRSSSIW